MKTERIKIIIVLIVLSHYITANAQSLSVEIMSFPPIINDTMKVCEGSLVLLESSVLTGQQPGMTIDWNLGNGTPSSIQDTSFVQVHFNTAATAQTVSVTVTNPGGEQAIASFILIVNSKIQLDSVILNHVKCHGGNDGAIEVFASSTTPISTYFWSPAVSTSSSAQQLTAGVYNLTMYNESCGFDTSFTITQPDTLWIMTWVNPPPDCGQTNGTVNMTGGGGAGGWVIHWDDGYQHQNHDNAGEGTYIVSITDANNCKVTDTVVVICPMLPSVHISGFLSPNGDGLNDYWVIENLAQYEHLEVKVFNRWGSQVFWSQPYNNYWDGTSKIGDQEGVLPAGTYYYYVDTHVDGQAPLTGILEIQP